MFLRPALQRFLVVGLLICLALSVACNSSEDSNGEEPVFDGDVGGSDPTDGDTPVDGDDTPLPACKPICERYCDLLKQCDTTGAVAGEVYAQCKESCAAIRLSGQYIPNISCGEEADCGTFVRCDSSNGDPDFRCDTGDAPDIDGDSPQPDGDQPQTDGDQEAQPDGDEEIPEGGCTAEIFCPAQTNCDPDSHLCLPDCDPYAPNCHGDQICKIITEPAPYGLGKGVCIADPGEGGLEGEICNPGRPCRPDFVCGDASFCEKPCNPNLPDDACTDGLRCRYSDSVGIGTCAFCHLGYPCTQNKKCLNGYCRYGQECESSDTCPNGESCFNGYCDDNCTVTGCNPGTCDADSGFCYADICDNGCDSGECCNRTSCGPCCSPACPAGQVCDYDPSCGNELSCCVDRTDCRDMPDNFCNGIPCDRETGGCRGACPASCPWNYVCGQWSGFECVPTSPQSCDEPIGGDCPTCTACDFWGSKQCVATGTCGISCIPRGIACTPTPGTSFLSCCDDQVCCTASSGSKVCCPPGWCQVGVGCVDPDADGDVTEDYTCPECDSMAGNWCKDPSATCPSPWEELIVRRINSYPCFFVLYHTAYELDNLLTDTEYCDSQALHFYDSPGYDECALYWDRPNDRYTVKCRQGTTSCSAAFSQSYCSK